MSCRKQEHYDWEFPEYRETRVCCDCSHYDWVNSGCWIIADDGIFRNTSPNDYCVFGFKEDEC